MMKSMNQNFAVVCLDLRERESLGWIARMVYPDKQ